jgi:hypothetical protein
MSLFNKWLGDQKISYMNHYHDECKTVGGDPCEVTLGQVFTDGRFIDLIYHWHKELSHQEADKLDSRLRAFIVCAVYDAAIKAGLRCTKGPPHGRRPSWFIDGIPVAFGLQSAGFDVSEKWCGLKLGPLLLGPGIDTNSEIVSVLAESFRQHFRKFTV